MPHNHPKVVVVGSRGSGKSTLIANISGIYSATATTCPIEWHLCPSATWSATVSVAYYHFKSSEIELTKPVQIGNPCSTPSQLQAILKRAELLVAYPGIDEPFISSLNEDAINRALESPTNTLSAGIIYVDLEGSLSVSEDITIVDMPGIPTTDPEEVCQVTFTCVNRLIQNYIQSEKTIIAVALPISDIESKIGSSVLSIVKSIDKDLVRTTVIFNHLDASTASFSSLEASRPYQYFYIHPFNRQRPFACSKDEIQSFRQDEAAFFRFSEPWSSQFGRDNLGVVNLLKAWIVLSSSISEQMPSQPITPSPIQTIIVWLLVIIISIYTFYLLLEGKIFHVLGIFLATYLVDYLR